MKRCSFVFMFIGATLLGGAASGAQSTEKKICREYINASVGNSPSRCSDNLRPVSSNYVVKGRYVYWMTQNSRFDKPCFLGTATAFIDSSSWRCLSSSQHGHYTIEERSLYGGARYTPAFHSLEGSMPLNVDWQKRALAHYAKDDEAVYFKGKKIVGADPKQFSVIFPFGEDSKWDEYHVSLSGRSLFLNGKKTEYVDLHKFKAFTPIHCPEHGLYACARIWAKDEFIRYDRVLGWVDGDVVLLQREGITRYSGMVSPDMFMFSSSSRFYIYSSKKFYELDWKAKIIADMDVGWYEKNSH